VTPSNDGSPGPDTLRDRRLLALAFGATFLARAVTGAVVESLRAELWLTDQALGTLAAVFAGAYAIALPAAAALAPRAGRRPLLVAGLLVCGAATAASAWAVGFWSLVVARAAAGAGAGVAALASAGLLLDGPRPSGRAPRRRLLAAAAAGLALGYLAGGLAGRWPGWHGAFIGSGGAVLLLGLASLRAAEPPRRALDPWGALRADGLRTALRGLATTPAAWLATAAAVVGVAGASALAFWLPALLERARGVPRPIAGVQLGVAVAASWLLGEGLGRAALGRLSARAGGACWIAGGATAAAAAAVGAALYHASPAVYLPCLLAALACLFTTARATQAALAGGLGPGALALALVLLHGAGDLSGAFGLGAVADRASFGQALLLLPFALLASALLWAGAAWGNDRRAGRGQRAGVRAARPAAGAGAGAPDSASL
jgi:MFS transporter, Spinster family, sphingosine-1-phosphate transporter